MNTLFSTKRHDLILKTIWGSLIILFLIGGVSSAFSRSTESEDHHQQPIYAFEFLTFKFGDGEKTMVELFCQVPSNDFQFIRFREGFLASYKLSVRLYDLQDNEIETASIIDSVTVETFKEIDFQRRPRLIRFTFPVTPGEYEARVNVHDLETLRNVSFRTPVVALNYGGPELSVSDLQIASSVTPCGKENPLVKNGYEVVPNVQRVACPKLNLVHGYVEVYNLQHPKNAAKGEFTTTYSIINEMGVQVKKQTLRHQKAGASAVLKLRIPVADLAAGQYELNFAVSDLDKGQTALKSTKFFVVQPELVKEFLMSQAPASASLDR